MRTKLLSSVAVAASMAFAIATGAHADDLVQNGSFNSGPSASTQFGAGYGTQVVPNWTGGNLSPSTDLQFYFVGNTPAANQWNDPLAFFPAGFTPSPDGGNFLGLDGDTQYQGSVSQQINGLVAGLSYTLTFDWAASQLVNRSLPTTEQLQVSLGGDSFTTDVVSVPSQGFNGWYEVSHTFTASAATETLSFLSIGTPNGQPPIALLDGVHLTTPGIPTQTSGAPEPASWAMMLVGFGGIGALIRRRRHALVAA